MEILRNMKNSSKIDKSLLALAIILSMALLLPFFSQATEPVKEANHPQSNEVQAITLTMADMPSFNVYTGKSSNTLNLAYDPYGSSSNTTNTTSNLNNYTYTTTTASNTQSNNNSYNYLTSYNTTSTTTNNNYNYDYSNLYTTGSNNQQNYSGYFSPGVTFTTTTASPTNNSNYTYSEPANSGTLNYDYSYNNNSYNTTSSNTSSNQSSGSTTSSSYSVEPYTASSIASQIMSYINQARTDAGLNALETDGTIQAIADMRAQELSVYYHAGYLVHYRPDGSSALDWIASIYGWTYAQAENIGWYDSSAKLDAWYLFSKFYNSPDHYNNLMNPSFNLGAVSIYTVSGPGIPDNGTGSSSPDTDLRIFVCMNFGAY